MLKEFKCIITEFEYGLKNNDYVELRLNAWTHRAVSRGPTSIGPHDNMLCTACLNIDFVGLTNTINICLILSTIYIFIPVSGVVGTVPSALLCPGPIMLLRRS